MNHEPLLDRCDNCDAEGALFNPQAGTRYCPACASNLGVETQAEQHLGSLIDEAASLWWDHWREVGLSRDQVERIVNTWAQTHKDTMRDDEERRERPAA